MSEIARVEEEANLILTASVIDNRAGGQAVKGVGTILSELKADGKIEGYDTTENADITNIKFDVSSITLGAGDNEELTATFESGSDAGGYYAQIKGKKYPVSKVNDKIEIGKTEIQTGTNATGEITEVSSSNTSFATVSIVSGTTDKIKITGESKGTATITVNYSDSIKTTLAVEVKDKHLVKVAMSEDSTTKGTVGILPESIDNKYVEGSKVKLTATENSGYQLEGWYNGGKKLSEYNPYCYTVGTSDVTITAKFKIYEKYGKTVNLGIVTANDEEMTSGWKYFLEDETNIYLIYGDFLENLQIPITGETIRKSQYKVSSTSSREDLIAYLTGTGNYVTAWSKINDAVKTAVQAKLVEVGVTMSDAQTVVEGITTKGAPTIEQWMNSYNEIYGTKLSARNFTTTSNAYYTSDSATAKSKGSNMGYAQYTGYLFRRDYSSSSYDYEDALCSDFMSSLPGYPENGSNMYYPRISRYSFQQLAYWLAGTCAKSSGYVASVQCDGYLGGTLWQWNSRNRQYSRKADCFDSKI